MDLPGVKNVSLKEKKKTHFSPTPQISLYDRVSLYLELANIQTKLNNAVHFVHYVPYFAG